MHAERQHGSANGTSARMCLSSQQFNNPSDLSRTATYPAQQNSLGELQYYNHKHPVGNGDGVGLLTLTGRTAPERACIGLFMCACTDRAILQKGLKVGRDETVRNTEGSLESSDFTVAGELQASRVRQSPMYVCNCAGD